MTKKPTRSGAAEAAQASPGPVQAESPPTMEAGSLFSPPAAPRHGQQPAAAQPVDPDAAARAPLAADDPANKTLEEIFGTGLPSALGAQPSQPPPGFAMQDEPFDDPRATGMPVFPGNALDPGPAGPPGVFPHSPDPYDPTRHAPGRSPEPPRSLPRPAETEFIPPPGGVRYESRIKVLEAFRYVGSFKGAPEWVDRNWLAHGDYDPLRGIEPGPALNVPTSSGHNVMCRVGDYVVQQEFILDPRSDGTQPQAGASSRLDAPASGNSQRVVVQLEVWSREAFERTFMPIVRSTLQGSPGTAAGRAGLAA